MIRCGRDLEMFKSACCKTIVCSAIDSEIFQNIQWAEFYGFRGEKLFNFI